MVQDAFGVHSDFDFANQGEEAPNVECKIFSIVYWNLLVGLYMRGVHNHSCLLRLDY